MNISLPDSVLETRKTLDKRVQFDLPNYVNCKLLQIVNFDGLWTKVKFSSEPACSHRRTKQRFENMQGAVIHVIKT